MKLSFEYISRFNLKVKNGELLAVVGPVGTGKSSLLSAILGQIEKRSGSVNVLVYFQIINKHFYV